MKPISRLILAATVVLGGVALTQPAHAAKPPGLTFSVFDAQSYEYVKDCSTQGPPFPCTTSSQDMYVEIWTPQPPGQQVTFGYAIDPITATQGVDYIGTTGTAVMPANTNYTFVEIPVIMDGVAEGSETLRVRLTSSSIGGNISDTPASVPSSTTVRSPPTAPFPGRA